MSKNNRETNLRLSMWHGLPAREFTAKMAVPLEIANRKSQIENITVRAFTFIEVMVALAIVSISMLALMRLHLVSINMFDTAELTSQAVFLAQEKIAEALSCGYPEEGTNYGIVEKNALNLQWQTKVTDLRMPLLDDAGITGLRKISADVTWKQGVRHKHLQITTYVADRNLP